MDFMTYLRLMGEWKHIFIDEFSEVSPANTSGKTYKIIHRFANTVKEARKCFINVHANTQATQDIDYRILTKIMISIFLPGSRTTKHSRILQSAIDNLNIDKKTGNEAYIEYSGRFGKTKFSQIYKPNPKYNWEARCNNATN